MKLQFLSQDFAICKLPADVAIPSWATQGSFYSVTRTPEELSILCEQNQIPSNVPSEANWKAFRVAGTLDFSLTGILDSMAHPMAEAKISIFAVSTFDTDYLLIKKSHYQAAVECLQKAGFTFV